MYSRGSRGQGRGRGGWAGRDGFRGGGRGRGRGNNFDGGRGDGRRGRGRGRGGSPRGRGGREKDCLDYKLLGSCVRQETGECPYAHRNKDMTVFATVKIPNKVPMASALKGDFTRSLKQICECRLRVSSEDKVDIVVSQQNGKHLVTLKSKYEVLVSQLYSIGPGWCYIHRDGVDQCEIGSLLKFRPYEGRLPPAPGQISSNSVLREAYITEEEAADSKCEAQAVKNPARETETKEGLHHAIDRVHGQKVSFNPKENRRDVGVKIIKDHEAHMEEMLKGALEWFCDKRRGNGQFVLKLEARFGKVLWRNIPEDVADSALGITDFSHLCFSDTKHSRIFNTNVRQEGVEAVRKTLCDEKISLLETFDLKFTIPRERERKSVDMRLTFRGEQPTLLLVKMNEAKVVVFDVLSLHRDHDIRMTLNFYEMVTPELSPQLYEVVQRVLRTVSYDVDEGKLTLQPRADEWSVNFIRHKKREAYRIDEKQFLTITSVREYQDPPGELSLSSAQHLHPHTEIEFHNSAWECAFGRDVGLPPEQCLVLHMESPAVDPAVARAIPHPWQPEHILKDFQEFWECLDSLNEMLGPL